MLKINIQLFADGGEAGGSNGNAAAFDADAEIAKRFPEEARAFAAAHKKADAQTETKQADAPAEKTERAGDDADPENTHGQEEFDEDAEYDLSRRFRRLASTAATRYAPPASTCSWHPA